MKLHNATNSLLVKVDDPFALRELIPKSRVLVHPTYNLAVDYSLESTQLLRNAGVQAPSPIQTQYAWPGRYKPWAHQRVMADFLTMHRRAFNLSDMGTGKTNSALWAADYLMQQGAVRKVLVLSPLSTMERVWLQDMFEVLMHRVASVVYGTRGQRLAALKVNADFYLLNHDGITIKDVNDAIRKNPDIGLVIVDEGSVFRNHDTKRYKALMRLLRPDMRVWWMTATPCSNAPTDAWAQARVINPTKVPQFFGQFRRTTMQQITTFKWAPKPDGYAAAFEALQPAVRFKKSDCLDLPPVVYLDRQAPLTQEQADAFKLMQKEMKAEAASRQITAVNAADRVNKLRQILCGAMRDPETGEYVAFPYGPRLEVLKQTIEQAQAKVIVVVPFKGIIQSLAEQLQSEYSVEVLNGDVSPKRRNQIIHAFKTQTDPHVLLCHPKVMSHGLNLTEADTLIFYAPIYSNDEYQQVQERFNRAGQTRTMTVVRMAAHRLEWEIYRLLNDRRLTQDNILNLYKSLTE